MWFVIISWGVKCSGEPKEEKQRVRRFLLQINIRICVLLPTLVDALKPVHHLLVILSHPVEIVLGPVDRLLSSSFRTTKLFTPVLPELNKLLRS